MFAFRLKLAYHKKMRPGKKKHNILRKTLLAISGLFALGVVSLLILIFITLKSLPSLDLLEAQQIPESTKIYDRTGEILIYELYGDERRTVIPLSDIPDFVKQSTVAIEDDTFYQHSGLNFKALLRAVIKNIRTGSRGQGGSTITQQLAKNVFLSNEKTFTRKFKELILTYKLEKSFSKDRILELYLNEIPYGGATYGIEAASQSFFSKSAKDLTLAEAALLASLPQAPSYYSPWGSHVDGLLSRKNTVLRKMYELGHISGEEMLSAQNEELKFGRLENLSLAPHFVLEIKEYLENTYGEDFVKRSGLQIITTLDVDLQKAAEEAVSAGAERNARLYNGTNGALVAQDAKTGQILALVGSRDYFDSEVDGQYNVATQGLRQPGSTLKPFAYLTALKMGYPDSTVLFDVKTQFSTDLANIYQPENFDGIFRGPVSFRTALSQSINVPAVKTLYLVGIENLLQTLQDFGISTLNDPRRYGLSLVLGGGEVRLIELVGAYSVLAQEGIYHAQHTILKVETRDGQILEEYKDQFKKVIEPRYPQIINDILSDVQARSGLFHSSLSLTVFPGHDVALKTGTTNDYRDAWAVGYTPSLVVGVWAGNNDNTQMQQQGGSILAAVPMLSAFLDQALRSRSPEAFSAPQPTVSPKPMLNGSHTATYTDGVNFYPQIHNILYYVNRSDPAGTQPINPSRDSQFAGWEAAVVNWATINIPGFVPGFNYNQPLPIGAYLAPPPTAPPPPIESLVDQTQTILSQ
ncbi:MAG: penicillin-binding protein [Candidatus Harrisonbacteria bacterium CG10_big_fil_rev_8_21_14_0_10_45_28]|uniref:Penicillin-binding protein n=1 Tax=Candidatus Harrisonbacteria bacterium CG10_big_fil_rev_8_21_14_0_10_45_28 TaxID=1974586 RepID=A0A2H0UN65_9BACT|nr:MAG: penicillin-binding protein [Candidatus Harrisonbacteria bacterium CG10_big_fil_rev_8_21_14_0_10_45_28]